MQFLLYSSLVFFIRIVQSGGWVFCIDVVVLVIISFFRLLLPALLLFLLGFSVMGKCCILVKYTLWYERQKKIIIFVLYYKYNRTITFSHLVAFFLFPLNNLSRLLIRNFINIFYQKIFFFSRVDKIFSFLSNFFPFAYRTFCLS